MYEVLLYVHVLSAVAWVGGSFFAQALAIQVERSGTPAEMATLGHRFELIGNRVFVPAAVLILLSGAAMTVQAWSFDQAWIAVSLVLWVVSAVAGALYVAPRMNRVTGLFEREGPDSLAARALVRRIFLVSRLELVSFGVIIALMVFKPGA